MKERLFGKRHHDDEIYDRVEIEAVPRYKTSGLSGDEWRVSYRVRIGRKGTTLFERDYTSLSAAVTHLPWVIATMLEGGLDGFDEAAWVQHINKDEDRLCHQVGCALPATVFYRLKQEFSERGEGPLPTSSMRFRVAFCQRHSTRGDCGREDSDRNYELLSGDPDAVSPMDERPAARVNLTVDSLDDIGPALREAVHRARRDKG